MPTSASSHETFLSSKVCGVCTLKPKSLQKINPPLLNLIKRHHCEQYDCEAMPTVICKGRVKILRELESEGTNANRTLPTIDYSLFVIPKVTRSSASEPCSCKWCKIGRMNGADYLKYQSEVREKGRPGSAETTPSAIKLCSICCGPIAKGISHTCNKTTRNQNLGIDQSEHIITHQMIL